MTLAYVIGEGLRPSYPPLFPPLLLLDSLTKEEAAISGKGCSGLDREFICLELERMHEQ